MPLAELVIVNEIEVFKNKCLDFFDEIADEFESIKRHRFSKEEAVCIINHIAEERLGKLNIDNLFFDSIYSEIRDSVLEHYMTMEENGIKSKKK